jgi:hypothetical protein
MAEGSMYGDRAELYERIYAWKDDAARADRVRGLLAVFRGAVFDGTCMSPGPIPSRGILLVRRPGA